MQVQAAEVADRAVSCFPGLPLNWHHTSIPPSFDAAELQGAPHQLPAIALIPILETKTSISIQVSIMLYSYTGMGQDTRLHLYFPPCTVVYTGYCIERCPGSIRNYWYTASPSRKIRRELVFFFQGDA